MVARINTVAFFGIIKPIITGHLFLCPFFFAEPALSEGKVKLFPRSETEIVCGGIKSTLVGYECKLRESNGYRRCEDFEWFVEGRVIPLYEDDFYIYKWACLPSDAGEKVLFKIANGGNCSQCEGLEIWEPYGERMADKEMGYTEYRRLNFPQKEDDNYNAQFRYINKP